MQRVLRGLRRTFLSGLLALLPLGLTLAILWLLYRLAYGLFGPHTAFARLVVRLVGRYIPGLEVAATVVLVFVVGVVVRHWVGRRVLRALERAILTLPGLRRLYWGTRQLAHLILPKEYEPGTPHRVVLVEFPHPGSYVLGVVTSEGVERVSSTFGRPMASVYVPTSPNPLSGWVLFVPQEKLIPAGLTLDEGITMVLSGGLVSPPPKERSASPGPGKALDESGDLR